MIYLIDAWLECSHPKLRLLNRATGEICLELSGRQLKNLQEQGILDINQLYSTDQFVIQELSNELLKLSMG